MKKLVFALCMAFGVVVVNAQDTTDTTSPTDPTISTETQVQEDQGRVKIKSQDLPDAVKSALEGQQYRGWLVNSAYKVDGASSVSTSPESDSTMQNDTTNVSGQEESGQVGQEGVGSHKQEVFIVELKNGAQTKTVRFDKDGKLLDDEEMKDDQK